MFLGWGALTGLVLLALFAVVTTLTPEPVAFIFGVVVITFVSVALALGRIQSEEPHTPTRASLRPLSPPGQLQAVPARSRGGAGRGRRFGDNSLRR